LRVRHAKLMRYDAERGDFLVVAGVGWQPGVVGVCRLGPGRESLAGFCVEVGEAVVSNHLEEERQFAVPLVLGKHGIHSAINVPIPAPVGGPARFWGVLEADGTGRSQFSQPDSAFLLLLVATLGACVERDARRAELRRLTQGRDAERDLLVQEVHHRVKNSLQLVTALLSTQARGSDVPAVREQLLEAAGRVATIGAVHERLYRDGSGEEADAAAYLAGLVEDLRRSMSDAAAGRTVALDAPPLRLPADRLTPLGLIATELVTNALKYGGGRVRLVVRPIEAGIEIACEDDGPGFPEAFDPRRSRGLGMRLVAALAKGADPVRVDRSVPHGRVVVTVAQT
jgi:two-component sensor histidine kinase